MSLPVSSYEDLLARVRDLTLETRRLQEQLEEPATSVESCQPPKPPIQNERVSNGSRGGDSRSGVRNSWPAAPPPRSLPLLPTTTAAARVLLGGDSRSSSNNYTAWDSPWANGRPRRSKGRRSPQLLGDSLITPPAKDDEMEHLKHNSQAVKAEQDGLMNGHLTVNGAQSHQSSSSLEDDTPDLPSGDATSMSSMYHGAWPVDRSLWHSGPSSLGGVPADAASVMSFTSSVGSPASSEPGASVGARRSYSQQTLGPKVEMVYGLLSMLGTHNKDEMSRTLLAMSSSADSCIAMRQSGCLPLLVQLLHGDENPQTRKVAAKALHNLVHSHPDDKRGRREARVLRLLEQVRDYCDLLPTQEVLDMMGDEEDDPKKHPGPTVANLMKLSFDEEHRHAMCQLGGLHALAQLIQADHEAHGSESNDQYCITLRRYAGMALTNLTFGDGTNKALLCSFRGFMKALVAQLTSPSEDLRQVTASVLRNLSWRADAASKATLREVGAVRGLMEASMEAKKESTLKSILSALWNLSAHCSTNKAEICQVEGALAFLVQMLTYKSPSQTLSIVENSGGILRNISSHVAIREDYRAILRAHGCLQVLLQQLKSPSLTVVSNACGTLWNLSARCPEDQRALWDMGAVSMLKSLVNSKHKMISMGSSAALKNLLGARPPGASPLEHRNSQGMPVLSVRKQRALEQQLDHNLSETCDNIEPTSPNRTSPSTRDDKYVFANTERTFDRRHRMYQSLNTGTSNGRKVPRSDSRESVKSDSVCDRVKQQKRPLTTNRSLDLQLNQDICVRHSPPATGTQSEGASPEDEEPVSLKEQVSVDDKEKSPEVRPPQYQNYVYEEDEDYQPVNYSLQYAEKNVDVARRFAGRNYGTYAETDLDNPDQPTNYSLRYGEEEEEEEKPSPGAYYQHSAAHEDSVKTYYTEGTPLNFSTATSISDLREAIRKEEKKEEIKKEVVEVDETDSLPAPSGTMSPEKPTQYCVEDTPVCFSRVSSLSSLHCSEGVPESVNEVQPEEPKAPEPEEASPPKNIPDKTLETPLVFSRCSSVASLTSFEQHSIHDDRSSIVSDFSRLTSGMVSPSELPDSPTQTQPPSPRAPKAPVQIVTSTPRAAPRAGPSQPQPSPRTKVTEGEGDDEKQDKEKELATVSEEEEVGDEDDSGLLDACISSGQQRLRASAPRPRFLRPRPSGIPTRIPRRLPRLQPAPNDACADAVQTFCTEDTPAISHAGSHSDLSVLSLRESAEGDSVGDERPKNASTREESDDSSFSGDNEHILAECIQSGMPKAKDTVKRKRPPRVLPSRDEIKTFAVEDTPFGLSTATSLSDLTINSAARVVDGQCYTPIRYATEDTPANFSHASSLSSLNVEEGDVRRPPAEAWGINKAAASSASEEVVTVVSRNGSLSSLSVESLGAEPSPSEQALLDQCISMGMSKSKSDLARAQARTSNAKGVSPDPSKELDCTTPTNPTSDTFSEGAKNVCPPAVVTAVATAEADITVLNGGETSSSSSKTTPEEAAQPPKVMTDTWTEDSPLSVSFPSLSGSVPLASSQDEAKLEEKFIISRSMEGMLELEAGRVVKAIVDEASSESFLEVTRPPPNMFGSTTSTSLSNGSRVPAVVLRALNGESIDHLLLSGSSSCTSHLDNVKPPAAFDEIDMENSMISVASITSEVAGDAHKVSSGESENFFDLMKPAATMAEIYCRAACAAANCHSFSEKLDSINPPSILQELTETLEPCSETLGSDTEPEDLPADQSNQSTPRQKRRPTPKERRQVMKERYNTYTIDDEVSVRPSNLDLHKSSRQRRMEEPERYLTQTIETPTQVKTPRQRRQDDKERYLTQTVQLLPSEEPQEPSESEEEAKPKIVKPSEEGSPKSIRGRRKALYTRPSTAAAKPPVVPKAPAGPTIRPTRASALRQRSSSPRSHSAPTPKKINVPQSVTPAASRTPKTPSTPSTPKSLVPTPKTIKPPVAGKTMAKAAPKAPNNSPDGAAKSSQPPKLVKQGTFTKDSTDTKVSKIPVRSPSADTITAAPAFRPQPEAKVATKSRLVRRDAVGPSKETKAPQPKPRSPLMTRRIAAGGLKTSLSNNSIQSEAAGAPLKVKTNSNPSLNGPKKKEVTSKIASLWKKVEDTRIQQKYGAKFGPKDTRVWITPDAGSEDAPVQGTSQGNLKAPARSTTFEKPAAGRLSIFNGGPSASKAAIVQPFNYSPPPPASGSKEEAAAASAGSVRVTSV
ncbi:adenomatous polyposis coli protein-like isoform X3 [Neocloeon triangulifer]|nr:adenomatous polyposis coli protein-like isoform X3 [Neocloeon triangulifer]